MPGLLTVRRNADGPSKWRFQGSTGRIQIRERASDPQGNQHFVDHRERRARPYWEFKHHLNKGL
jgi:hypothetical protein